tara:strand:- start:1896 stop:2528 length:633 start_codon:yes stop_codon:yes gene_type:complete
MSTDNNEMTSSQLQDYIKEQSEKDSNDEPIYTYSEMLIYNDLVENDKIGDGLQSTIDVYDKLYEFGLSLSGFQFIGLVLEKSLLSEYDEHSNNFAFFMLAFGFIISLFGSLLSFCMYEYLTYIKHESDTFIVKGIINYRTFLKSPHIILLSDTFCFALPINILIHNNLTAYYAYIFNFLSLLLLFIGFKIHRLMIINKQNYSTLCIDKED